MVVIAFTEEQWRNLCRTISREDLINDERYCTPAARNRNREGLEAVLSQVFLTKARDEWLSLFEKAGVVCGPVNNIAQVVADPHVRSRDMILEVSHERLGKLNVVGTPMKFSRTPCKIGNASPDLGRHTEEVLTGDLNMSADEIRELKKISAI
jgi:crotonobetainyl-CoA:carnitine CoA-transferase CaiB-like acyl-CoA transferase